MNNHSIPYITNFPLKYVFENMKLIHKHDTLWLEFGVFQGRTINYISSFTNDKVYGFDCFNGLPEKWIDGFEKGTYDLNGQLPRVKENVILIKGLFQDTLTTFLNSMNKKVSFVHIDCDLYSSTKHVLNNLLPFMDDTCIVVFYQLVNYPGFEDGELKALNEFVLENQDTIKYEWIGMNRDGQTVAMRFVR